MKTNRRHLATLLLLAGVAAVRCGAPEPAPEPERAAMLALPVKVQPCQKSEEGKQRDLYAELRKLRANGSAPKEEIELLMTIGLTHRDEAALRSARALARSIGDKVLEGRSLNYLGAVAKNSSKLAEAVDHYDKALELLPEEDGAALPTRAVVLQNQGDAYLTLNRLPDARDVLEQSIGIRKKLDRQEGEARVLAILGQVHAWGEEWDAAFRYYVLALGLARGTPSCLDDAEVLDKIGTVYQEQGKFSDAAAAFQEVAEIYEEEESWRFLAWTTASLGRVRTLQGYPGDALGLHRRAFRLAGKAEDRGAQAYSLYGQAEAERKLGERKKAAAHIREAVEILESLRADAPAFSLQETFFSPLRTYYELQAGILMEMWRKDPEAGTDALEATERYRSRSFLDTLALSAEEIRRDVPEELLERELQLRETINKTEELLSLQHPPRPRPELERELRGSILDYDKVQADIRKPSARDQRNRPVPLTVLEMQGELDDQTVLLVYFLGEEKSFVWRIDPRSVRSFELPPRRQIERQAREAWALLSRTEAGASLRTQRTLAALSQMILGPLAGDLGPHRLAVVPDGALRMIPFNALPAPQGDPAAGRPLIQDREVVHIESASVLSLLRRQTAGRRAQLLEVAGVFDLDFGSSGLARLEHSRSEADELRKLVPADRIAVHLGSTATRELVLGGGLGRARIVHFATHGILHPVHPELSKLVLSQGSELRAYELFGLDLPADLVVLSACRTLADPTSRGQGLVGMTRGFMVAGAPRVIYSLWSVNDRSTAELMKHFYRAHFEGGLRPAAALREAQIAMLSKKPWQEPYFWAPFVFEGDWR